MNTIKMAVFDMAGTVVDEHNLVYKTIQTSFQDNGYPVTLEKVLAVCAGKEKYTAIITLVEALGIQNPTKALAKDLFDYFKARLATAYQEEAVAPMPGSEKVFQYLAEHRVMVVLNTGYDRSTAEQLVGRLGWENHPYIQQMVTASDVAKGRPEPDMIQLAMAQAKLRNSQEVIKIGDSQIDILEGRQAHCQMSIGITTGAHTLEQLQQVDPDAIIDHLQELIPLLEEMKALPA
ncbi:MAG: HAD hydrolase-like protein [Bacteroidota bacterium]